MKNKYTNIFIASILTVTAVATLLFAVAYFNRPADVYASQNNINPVVQPTAKTEQNGSLYPLIQKNNGVRIELIGVKNEGEYFRADFCFDFPSNDPAWRLPGPDSLILSNGVQDVGVYSIDLIPDEATGDLKKDDKGKYTGRCDQVRFPITEGFALEYLTITINNIITDASELPDCKKAQAKLDSIDSGIVIKCINGEGVSGVDIVKKPKDMGNEKAQKIIDSALHETVEGPWIFDVVNP